MSDRPVIAIVGGGLAGTLAASNLLTSGRALDVVVVEPRGDIGPGVAYSTTDERHLLNVPARVLGARSSSPEDFVGWLRSTGRTVEPGDFVPRAWFGDYLRATLQHATEAGAEHGATLRAITGEVSEIVRRRGRERLRLADGTTLDADHVVLAIGSPATTRSRLLAPHPRTYAGPWQPGALDSADGGLVLLVGSGLTAIDAALSICDADPAATIVMLSRSGLLPRVHAPAAPNAGPATEPPWPAGPLSARDIVDTFHTHVDAVAPDGHGWRDVLDALRPRTQELWQRMPVDEQRRFRSEHGRAWERHRHRMAPAIAQRLAELRDSGRIELVAARLLSIELQPSFVGIAIAHRSDGAQRRLECARVIDCTGIDNEITRSDHPLVRSLLDRERLLPDEHELGIRADREGHVLDSSGRAQPSIRVLGHLRRGELWETTAVVEIRAQAEAIADAIARPTRLAPAPTTAASR